MAAPLQLTLAESPYAREFAACITRPHFVVGTLTTLLIYWLVFGWSLLQMVPRLDAGKILPSYSRIQRPNHILHDIIWREYQAVNVIVNRPFRVERAEDRRWLEQLVAEFERLHGNLGGRGHATYSRNTAHSYLRSRFHDALVP